MFRRQRRRANAVDVVRFPGFYVPDIPPVVLGESSINPLRERLAPLVWRDLALMCPIQATHSIEVWKDPGRCPRCGNFMERNGFPYRSWD